MIDNLQNHPIKSNNSHLILGLDGVRGLCILFVIFHNLYPYGSGLHNIVESSVRLIANMGWMGVQWFFVLSGFLITSILIKLKGVEGGLKNFYIRRALRIFPVYYLTLIVFIFVLPLFGFVTDNTKFLIDNQSWYWLYVNNWMPAFGIRDLGFAHLWSLAVEEQFYCIWPWLVLWLPRRWMIFICMFCVVSSPVLRYLIVLFDEADAKELAYDLTIVRWDALAIGALFAFASTSEIYKKWIDTHGAKFTIGLFVAILGVVAMNRSFAPVGPDFLALNQTLAAFLGVVLLNESISNAGLFKGRLNGIFESSFLRMLGKYSYAIYVFHLIIGFMMRPSVAYAKENLISVNPIIIAFVALFLNCIAAILLAAISWRLIEYPLLKFKNRFPVVVSR